MILPAITLEQHEAEQMSGIDLGEGEFFAEDGIAEEEAVSDDINPVPEEVPVSSSNDAETVPEDGESDYLIHDENGISDDEWDQLLGDDFFVDDGVEELTEEITEIITEETTEKLQEQATEETTQKSTEDITEIAAEQAVERVTEIRIEGSTDTAVKNNTGIEKKEETSIEAITDNESSYVNETDVDIEILKVDENGTPLDLATFKLQKKKNPIRIL